MSRAPGPSRATVLGVLGLFLAVQLGALAFAAPFAGGGAGAVENPGDPTFGVVYLVGVLVVSGLLLVAVRRGATWVLRAFAVFASGLLSWFVLLALLPPVAVAGVPLLPTVGAAGLVALLVVYPEWYVINAVGVLTGVGAAGLVGVTLGVLPVLVLLTALSVYDAVAVYGTGHMGSLAGGAVESRAPVLFVVPGDRSFSYLDREDDEGDGDEKQPRPDGGRPPDSSRPPGEGATPAPPGGALFVGLGDAVMPTTLAVSAVTYLPAPLLGVPVVALSLPALGAVLGTLAGLGVLLLAVRSGRVHAGLPPLNGGAVLGYLLGALAAGVPLTQALGIAGAL
jgi:presenilin-like A22 family membrane protease